MTEPHTTTAPIRWGIAGTGKIAANFAADFAEVPDAELVAVGSRTPERAQEFATAHHIERAHGSYVELIADPQVQVIYIATPHPQHRDLALAAMAAGKAVLVEKAFTVTVPGAEEVVAAARAAGVFCMEAMWTRFQPAVVRARELIEAGTIGEVRQVSADLGALREFDPTNRLFDPALGGGATLDLGVYVLSIVQHFLGEPERITAHGSLASNGVDLDFGALLAFSAGRVGLVSCGLDVSSPGRTVIMGTSGSIEILPRFHHPSRMRVQVAGAEAYEITAEPVGRGYASEIMAVDECLRAGLSEHPMMPLDDTLAVQRMMTEVLDQLGYAPAEGDLDL